MVKEMTENMPRVDCPIIPYIPERSYYLEDYDMELAFDEGYGYKIPVNTLISEGYTTDDIREGVRNFAKLMKQKARKHNIPLDIFGDYVVRKPSNHILISPVFMGGVNGLPQ